MAIAAFSTVVEWYDFTLYLYLATLLSRVFFGGGGDSLAWALGGFAVAYLMRPIGAAVFGLMGDRFGRRRMMLGSMALMTFSMLATALLPTHSAIGPAAAWLLLLLRCLMGFSVGGEYTGVVAYLLESAPMGRRGLITSLAAAASEVGGLLAAGVSAWTVASLDSQALESWGWRIPFWVGGALAASVWLGRSLVQESPEFLRQQAAGSVPPHPLRHVLAHHRAAIARGFAISALGSITYYVGITYVPAFLMAVGQVDEGRALWMSTLAAAVVILVSPLVGWLSDRVGRKPVLLWLCAGSGLLPVLTFSMMASHSPALVWIGILLLAALGGAVSAVGAVATAEQLPGEGRLSGLALGATGATALFGGMAPSVAHALVQFSGSPVAAGALIAVVALGVLPVFIRLPESRPVAFETGRPRPVQRKSDSAL